MADTKQEGKSLDNSNNLVYFFPTDNPYDEGEPGYRSSSAFSTQDAHKQHAAAASGLEFGCNSELIEGFKGMLSEMSKDPREVQRLRNPNKMRKQRSTTSSKSQLSCSGNSSTTTSTTSSILTHKQSPARHNQLHSMFASFIEEEEDTHEKIDEEEEQGLEVLLETRAQVKNTHQPTFQLVDDESSHQDQQNDINIFKGKKDLKQWASRLVAQKRSARNIRCEKVLRNNITPLANSLTDVSEDTAYMGRPTPAIIQRNRNLERKAAVQATKISEIGQRQNCSNLTYPDDERISDKGVNVRSLDTSARSGEIANIVGGSCAEPTYYENETPIRSNTTSSNKQTSYKGFNVRSLNTVASAGVQANRIGGSCAEPTNCENETPIRSNTTFSNKQASYKGVNGYSYNMFASAGAKTNIIGNCSEPTHNISGTHLQTNTASSKPLNINQNKTGSFPPKSKITVKAKEYVNFTNVNFTDFAPCEVYQSEEVSKYHNLPPRQSMPMAAVPLRQSVSSRQMILEEKDTILMTPPPLNNRIPRHLPPQSQVNVVSPVYNSAPSKSRIPGSSRRTQNDIMGDIMGLIEKQEKIEQSFSMAPELKASLVRQCQDSVILLQRELERLNSINT